MNKAGTGTDMMSYILGYCKGKSVVEIDGGIDCADDGDGNITISEVDDNGD